MAWSRSRAFRPPAPPPRTGDRAVSAPTYEPDAQHARTPRRHERAPHNRPLGLRAYALAGRLVSPLVPLLLRARMRRGKEDPKRLPERLGHPARERPQGPLVWVHGASVGETLSVLPLVEALQAEGHATVMLTSGTMTSARLMATRLPPPAFHHFVPIDIPRAAERFIGHFRPDLALFVESEVWPTLLSALKHAGTPVALVNARMSARSAARWGRLGATAQRVFALFTHAAAPRADDAARLSALGVRDVRVSGTPQ